MANETVLFKRGDSATITSTPVTDGQILFDTSGNGKMYLDNGTDRLEMGGAITVDASLSKTSTNAIQNKAVTGNILNSLAEVSAATQQNTIAGALALKEVNNSLTKYFNYWIDNGYLPDPDVAPLIPVMTSNTTPSGVASAISEYSNYHAYYAFRNLYDNTSNSECWHANDSKGASHSNLWLMYKFPKAVTVKKFRIFYVYTTAVNYKIQGSNDGNTFVDLGTFTTIRGEEQIQNTNAYLYYRLFITTQTTSPSTIFGGCVRDLQLYGY